MQGLPRPDPLALRTLKAPEVATKDVYRLPMLFTTVASPCQALFERQAGDHAY